MNDAVSLNHTRSQWVDLGILQEACMPRLETSGVAGGAVVFWMRITHANVDPRCWHGIIISSVVLETRFCIGISPDGFMA